ncbi:hypothetical protein BKI52_36830 [marine bacterium AO1-C]|nr:hypothetical protein BKI52_36830 [marine bacterium AO1-C]
MSNTTSLKAKKSKKNNFARFITVTLMLVGGALIGYLIGGYLKGNGATTSSYPTYYKVLLFPMILGVIFFVLAIHELGHVFAGISVGFEFRMITVGPFMLRKESTQPNNKQLRFRWNTRLNAMGGLALCLPKSDHKLRPNFIKFIAGGPLASLLLAVLAATIYWLFYRHNQAFFARNFWQFTALMSGIIFLTTIIPMRSGGFFSDGARMLNLLRGGPKAEVDLAILTSTAAATSGVRPREMNIAPLQKILVNDYQHPFIPYLHLYMYAYLMDWDKPTEALIHLKKTVEEIDSIPAGYQATVWLEVAFYKAYYQQSLSEAEEAFKQAKISAIIPKHLIYKSEAAIAWLKEDKEKALTKAQDALNALDQSMDAGGAIAEKEWLEEFIKQIG